MRLAGRVDLVTGASGGIGGEVARALARSGAAVGVHFHTASTAAEAVVSDIVASGGRACAVKADVRNRSEVAPMVATVGKAFGPVDILANSTRQLGVKKKFLALDWAEYESQINVILKGAFHCCQAVLLSMIERAGGGRIVNILSTIIDEPNWRWYTYGAAKGALWQLTRHLAAEMGPHGITVNTVLLGFTRTERKTMHNDEYLQQYLNLTPLARFMRPEEVADAVVFWRVIRRALSSVQRFHSAVARS